MLQVFDKNIYNQCIKKKKKKKKDRFSMDVPIVIVVNKSASS